MNEEELIIKCPQCGSTDWRCWDEGNEIFICDDCPDDYFEWPVGYLKCVSCGHDWADYGINEEGCHHAGRNVREAFGWEN